MLIVGMLLLQSCANIVPPEGGERDLTPPVLLSVSPSDSQLNTKVTEITLRFNKFVELNNLHQKMELSPLMEVAPTVTSYGKRIEIKIADSVLKPNTTYRISLGNAITDNREKTPLGNFAYTFSTGPYFDSLQLTGQVIIAQTGLPDTSASILLYSVPFSDSSISQKRPMYITKTDQRGIFQFFNLPATTFRMIAVSDYDNNQMYSGNPERIGFLDKDVQPKPAGDSTEYVFYTFTTEVALRVDSDSVVANPYIGRVINKDNNARKYLVQVDTANLEKGTTDLKKPVKILLNAVLGQLDSSKIYLFYNNSGIDIETRRWLSSDSTGIYVHSNYLPDTRYTLHLVKGWATDTAGAELPPDRISFRTKRSEDYASLRLLIPARFTGPDYLLVVHAERDTVYQKAILDSIVTIPMLEPGTYFAKIVYDKNKNGKWDTGNFFKKEQPETIWPNHAPITLKAGWEHEEDFKYEPKNYSRGSTLDRPNADGKPSLR